MDRFLRLSLVTVLALAGAIALPTTSVAASLNYEITNLQHPSRVVAGANYNISGKLVDDHGHAVDGGTVYLGSKSPAKTCDPAECAATAYSTYTKSDGTFSFPGNFTELDIAYVL